MKNLKNFRDWNQYSEDSDWDDDMYEQPVQKIPKKKRDYDESDRLKESIKKKYREKSRFTSDE